MSDEEDYRSSEDEDYVPSDGEPVSEEENSGEEENLGVLDPSAVRRDGEKRKRKKDKKLQPRKRLGGIKLEGETVVEEEKEEEPVNKQLAEEIVREKEQKKEEQEKKKADDLWSSFMSDVGKGPPKKTAPAGSGLGSLGSINRPVISSRSPRPSGLVKDSGKVTVTKVYDFAGEAVSVTKEVDAGSKEAQEELKKQEEDTAKTDTCTDIPQTQSSQGVKRPSGGGGLGGLLDKINKKPKMGTLEKSRLDWDTFKKKEGIEDELAIHNRGKQSFIERQNFLQRADLRQFEIEKNLRLSTSKR